MNYGDNNGRNNNNGRNQQTQARPQKTFGKLKLDKKDYVNKAEEVVNNLPSDKYNKPITSNQIRNVLSLINELYDMVRTNKNKVLSEDVQSHIQYVKMKIIYMAGRENSVKVFIEKSLLVDYLNGIVIIIVIIIVVVINKAKNKQVTVLSDINLSDNEDTVIIGNDYDGNTELLFDDETGQRQSVILRDVSDSMRIFEVQLSAQGMVIGRSSDLCNIVIDYDKSISRKHCKILLKNGLAYIADLNSGNKTYVNDMEILSETRLNNADEIKIGRTRFRVTIK